MQRKFLEDLNVEKEIIDKIMAENGRDIEKQKKETEKLSEKVTGLETELENNKNTLIEANKEIEKYKGMDIESIQKSAEEWKQKYEEYESDVKKQRKEFENQMQVKEYEFAAKEYINKHTFSNDFVKDAFLKDFLQKGLKLENGKFLGADDYIHEFKEANPGIFIEEENENKQNPQESSTYQYIPQGGENTNEDLTAVVAAAVAGNI